MGAYVHGMEQVAAQPVVQTKNPIWPQQVVDRLLVRVGPMADATDEGPINVENETLLWHVRGGVAVTAF